jgi:hypothetical protein
MSDLKLWLQSLGLEKYGEALADHDVDLNVVSYRLQNSMNRRIYYRRMRSTGELFSGFEV